MDGSGLLKLTELGANMQINRNPRPSYSAPTPPPMPTPPMPTPLQQLAAAEGHHDSKGYELGTREGYEAFAKLRADSLAESLGLETPPTHEQLLQEVWYLRRRVKTLEKQVFEMGWQISGESMGR